MKRQEKNVDDEKVKPTTKKAKKTTKATEKLPAGKSDVNGGGKVVGEEEKEAGVFSESLMKEAEMLPPAGWLTESCCWDVDENWPCYCLFCAAVEQISWGTSWLSPAWDTAELVGGRGAVEACHDHRSACSSYDDVVWDDRIWDLKEFNEEDFNSPS